MARETTLLAHGAYGSPEDRVFIAKSAKGSLVEDVDGNHYIDFGAGWGTNNVGNCHPEVVEAVSATLKQFGVTCWTSAAARGRGRSRFSAPISPLAPRSSTCRT